MERKSHPSRAGQTENWTRTDARLDAAGILRGADSGCGSPQRSCCKGRHRLHPLCAVRACETELGRGACHCRFLLRILWCRDRNNTVKPQERAGLFQGGRNNSLVPLANTRLTSAR